MTAPYASPASAHATVSATRPSSRPATRASSAPPAPTPPQASICHGVHGPCPKNTLEVRAATAPTANPGAPPSTYPPSSTMSVVGLTLGIGANATRPSAASAAKVAISASTRALGCVRSYQAKPITSAAPSRVKEATTQLTGQPPVVPEPSTP